METIENQVHSRPWYRIRNIHDCESPTLVLELRNRVHDTVEVPELGAHDKSGLRRLDKINKWVIGLMLDLHPLDNVYNYIFK